MNFVNYKDLVEHTEIMCKLIPKPDIVCAIPRSGLLPASILALHWNLPLTTPHLLLKGDTIGSGKRLATSDKIKRVLVFDDSCNHMETMNNVKKMLEPVKDKFDLKYGVVYAREKNKDFLDYHLGTMEQPRHFQWNWLHHNNLIKQSGFDIDGVLCRPPTREENDRGTNYEKFLKETEPWFIPTVQIGAIVTGRLEKYRELTKEWLLANGVMYNELIMRKDDTVPHPMSKIDYLNAHENIKFFVEDEEAQANAIRTHCPGKIVLCTKGWRIK